MIIPGLPEGVDVLAFRPVETGEYYIMSGREVYQKRDNAWHHGFVVEPLPGWRFTSEAVGRACAIEKIYPSYVVASIRDKEHLKRVSRLLEEMRGPYIIRSGDDLQTCALCCKPIIACDESCPRRSLPQ